MQTERIGQWGQVSFRATTESDLDWVLAQEHAAENNLYVAQWTRKQHQDAIAAPNTAHWMVAAEPDDRPIGYLILSNIDAENRNVEFRRIVITEKGQGYGRMALRLLKKVAFENLNAHRLWLDVRDNNPRARHLYESEGFVVEGVMRECQIVGGEYVSLVLLSMLEDEYREQKPDSQQA